MDKSTGTPPSLEEKKACPNCGNKDGNIIWSLSLSYSLSLTFITCKLYIKFTPCPAVLPWLCCFEKWLDDVDGDDGDHGDDDHVDDGHADGDHVDGDHADEDHADGDHGCREDDESDDAGDGSPCDDDHHAHDVCVHDVNAQSPLIPPSLVLPE